MPIHVTLHYGGLAALLVALLGLNHSRRRKATATGPGTPLPPELVRPARAHANAAEWIPLGLVLLLAIELTGRLSSVQLHLLGGAFLLGRILHAAGMLTRTRLLTAGATLNYLVILAMAGTALALAFTRA
jgi:uncharacterized membrane protein YecN with MAPEG domain